MKKIIGFFLIMILLVGCGKNELAKTYENVIKDQKIMKSYGFTLKLNWEIDKTLVNINLRAKVANDNANITYQTSNRNIETKKVTMTAKEMFVYGDKTYLLNDEGKYELTEKNVKFNNISLYLDTLNNIKEITNKTTEKIDKITYQKYEVIYEESFIKKVINDLPIDASTAKNIKGAIYLDENQNINKITYEIGKIIVIASYDNIDKNPKIVIPEEILSND